MDKKNYSVISIVSLIAGVIGMLTTCLFVGIIPCIAGLVLSIISFFEKGTKKILSVIGMVCSIIGIVLFIILMAIPSEDTDKTKKSEENKTEVSATEIPKETQKPKEKATAKPKPTEKPKTKKQIKNEYISSCKEYNYKKVLRNPKKYIGKRIKVRIQISSVHDKSFLNPTKYYFGNSKSDYGWYGNQYAVYDKRISKKPKLLESDIIEVYGEIIEPEETTSLIVNSTELFTIDMKYVKLIKE